MNKLFIASLLLSCLVLSANSKDVQSQNILRRGGNDGSHSNHQGAFEEQPASQKFTNNKYETLPKPYIRHSHDFSEDALEQIRDERLQALATSAEEGTGDILNESKIRLQQFYQREINGMNTATECGDGIKQDGEDCDAGEFNSDDGTYGCTTQCSIQIGWECDEDSNCEMTNFPKNRFLTDYDYNFCSSYMVWQYTQEWGYDAPFTCCGDGYYTQYEECDDGYYLNGGDDSFCNSDCTFKSVTPAPTCSMRYSDYSSSYDQVYCIPSTSTCGNGVLDGLEECDDMNSDDYDGCTNCVVDTGCTCSLDVDIERYTCDCLCGDGYYDATDEECDDGNRNDGDGCDYECNIESSYGCYGDSEYSYCYGDCGDGILQANEECDDGNDTEDDGYGNFINIFYRCYWCYIEDGEYADYFCPVPGEDCIDSCNDGQVQAWEECDDGNANYSDGCSECQLDLTFMCETVDSVSVCTQCGNGATNWPEECDDGNQVDGDGCSSDCVVEDHYECEGGDSDEIWLDFCEYVAVCGNGLRELDEECDNADNDDVDNVLDGCIDCVVQDGYSCTGGDYTSPDTCLYLCGNGAHDPEEECDNSFNNIARNIQDGCIECVLQPGYTCSGGDETFPDTCEFLCGKYYVEDGEECDDGNLVDGDGCDSYCQVEEDWSCTGGSSTTLSTCKKICGNGIKSSSEHCDDGNTDDEDGCSSICIIEEGFTCTTTLGALSVCTGICGDGRIRGAEACDDGNDDALDGCSATCQVENGYTCGDENTYCVAACGDGYYTPRSGEVCDDGDSDDDNGCDNACSVIKNNWICNTVSSGINEGWQTCERACGNGVVDFDGEVCDDGNYMDGDGCNWGCEVENGWTCPAIGGACSTLCGDGIRAGAEVCDDGNTVSNDGCKSDCSAILPSYYVCPQAGGACHGICADGLWSTDEACDDGNYTDGDGCEPDCTVTAGYTCTNKAGKKSTCTWTCGDGKHQAGDECDDGNRIDGDGCDNTCVIEAGYACTGGSLTNKDTCTWACGNGVVDANEDCDDGNYDADDGCSEYCLLESGYVCEREYEIEPDTCTTACGDGVIYSDDEECDDGNTTDGDGCDSTCVIETDWTCSGTPSICTGYHGDGYINGDEECDDNNFVSNDGCTAGKIDMGYSCFRATSVTPDSCFNMCGDAFRNYGDECDDGNTSSNDGCSSTCTVEVGYRCHGGESGLTRDTCEYTCGDGILQASEECDDGNYVTSDGCNECEISAGYECTRHTPEDEDVCTSKCGDSYITGDETCDDGNIVSGDGCSSTCVAEYGWQCYAGYCTSGCGDGVRNSLYEDCDDGNYDDGDGCTSECYVEAGYKCTQNIATEEPDTCSEVATGTFTTGGLNYCNQMIDSYFYYTTEYDTMSRSANQLDIEYGPSCDEGTTGNKVCDSYPCQLQRVLNAQCYDSGNGLIKIKVRTNGVPYHCMYSPTASIEPTYTDFEVVFNGQTVGVTTAWTNINTQSDLDSTQCYSRLTVGKFPYGGISPKLQYKNNYPSSTDREFVGVALDGALIYSGNYKGQDPFYPKTGSSVLSTIDDCLGKIDPANPTYRYYSYSPCLFSYTTLGSRSYAYSCSDGEYDCTYDPLTYATEETDSFLQYSYPIGIAKDGRFIYSPFKNEYGDDVEYYSTSDVDVCNGLYINGQYVYVMTNFFPYTIGCWGPGNLVTTLAPTCSTNGRTVTSGSSSNAASISAAFNALFNSMVLLGAAIMAIMIMVI